MRKVKPSRLPIVLVLFAALAVGTTGASAAPPVAVSGTYVYTSSAFESFRQAGGNVIIGLTATVEYTGTFTGTSTVQGFIVVHSDGSANFHDVEVFTGTVNGVPGTVTFNLTGSNNSALDVKVTSTIVSATGGLSGLTGLLRLAGSVKLPEGPFGTYSGQIG
jgi:hypothetical protein